MGNYVSNQRDRRKDGGCMVKLILQKDSEEVFIKECGYLLTWVYRTRKEGKYNYQILPCSKFDNDSLFFEKKQDFEKINLAELDELEQFILHKLYLIDNSVSENLKSYNFHKLYKELLNFCALDLSSFYFDIRKDVLYCDSLNSKKRKNCVTVLNIILESLLKWFAPILVFTTEEIYSLVDKKKPK